MVLPLLSLAADGEEHRLRDAIEQLADHFYLTEDERKELLPSGSQATFDNRVGWARTYIKKAGLLESPRRGYFRITDRGLQALKQKPETINVKFLEQYPEFLEFKTRSNTESTLTLGALAFLFLAIHRGFIAVCLGRLPGRGIRALLVSSLSAPAPVLVL